MDREILNIGLDLAMAFGECWLDPIQDRLKAIRPELSAAQLDAYNSECQNAMNDGNALVFDFIGRDFGTDKARQEWERRMLEKYPWISKDNLIRNFSQGCYYAMR